MTTTDASRPTGALPRRVYAAVFLLSLAVLMLQVALNRLFSFMIWYHFAYISISLALLGFGASGSMLAAFPSWGLKSDDRAIGVYSALAALTTLGMLTMVGTIPLQPFDMLDHKIELVKLVLFFFVVSLPFFFAGMAITIALRAAGREVNRLYFWDLIGAGLGCALVVGAINWLETPRVAVLVAAIFGIAGGVAAWRDGLWVRSVAAAAVILSLASLGPLPAALPFMPSRDKPITPWLENGVHHYKQWSALMRTDLLGARGGEMKLGGYRRQGISPHFEGESPSFRTIAHDGGANAIVYQVTPDLRGFEMFRHHVLTAPYVVKRNPEVLIIGVGGGADIINALVNGAKNVTGAELNPVTIDLITNKYRDYTGGIYSRPDVNIIPSEGRHFVRSSGRLFDLLQITGVDTEAALSSGAYILSENYLYTVQSYIEYMSALREDGILSMAGLDFHPATGAGRHSLRFGALSFEALREMGVERPHEHVMVIGGAGQGVSEFEVLTKKTPFTDAEIDALQSFVAENGFQAWYLPNRPEHQQPLFRVLLEGSEAEHEKFFEDTFLNLRATTDNQPFYYSFYKWRHLWERRDEIDRGHTLATGQIILALMLALAVLFSVVAIVLPLLRVGAAARAMPQRWGFLTYFAALGVGFIFAEISFVQKFILFLGYPTYSLTLMLFSFLTAAGIGAHFSGRLPDDPKRVLPSLVGVLSLLVLFYLAALSSIFDAFLGSSLAVRAVVAVALTAPLGVVLGTFFPYGIRLTSALNRDFVAWAWAVNGCMTVVGSVLSIILAMTFGFTSVIVLFLAIYWGGAASFARAYARSTAARALDRARAA